jgi:DNA repair protein RadD
MELRPYQISATNKLRDNIRNGVKSQLLCAYVGAGKTVMSSAIIQSALLKGKSTLFLAHRRELIEQCAQKLESFGVLDYNIIMSGDKRNNHTAKVHVASIQTLLRRELPHADLIIIDEAHRAAARGYRTILANYPNAAVLGLSGTPERLDGKGLDDLFSEMVEVISVSELIEQGFLIKPDCYGFKIDESELKNVRKRGGDYDEGELEGVMNQPKLIGDITTQWTKLANDKLTVIFACGIEHSKNIISAFEAIGVSVAHLDGSMSIIEREKIISAWRKGEIRVVSNVGILTEGFDFPELECCVLARPTQSLSLYIQMCGRIMRTHATKDSAIILDHSNNVTKHGKPSMDRVWTLEGETEKRNEEKHENICCAACALVYEPNPVLFLGAVQEKLIQSDDIKKAYRKHKEHGLSACNGCSSAVCLCCDSVFKIQMEKVDIEGVAFTNQAYCPSCNALYVDDKAHVTSDKERQEIENTSDDLVLIGDEIPMPILVKNRFNQHLKTAKENGFKRGFAYFKTVEEFGEEARSFIPRHTGAWYKVVAA